MNFFDRQGMPISQWDWIQLRSDTQNNYCRIALDRISEGIEVSTVWLGIDYSFGLGAKQIFETMVFSDGDGGECYRWPTEELAIAGHDQIVAELKSNFIIEG